MELRRSTRVRQRPRWFADYVVDFPVRRSRVKPMLKADDVPRQPEKVAVLPLPEALQELPVERLRQAEEVTVSSPQPVMADPEVELVQLEEECLPSPEPVIALPWPEFDQTVEMALPSPQPAQVLVEEEAGQTEVVELPSPQVVVGHPRLSSLGSPVAEIPPVQPSPVRQPSPQPSPVMEPTRRGFAALGEGVVWHLFRNVEATLVGGIIFPIFSSLM
ncbi:magnetosome-associated protein MamJ-like [Saccostrea cucullata]|uniref:magnetosome-associated protein MamJ-like n=1 Tax=Saccostrea cuccullata TaxID=36930 RepID=UPI002ED39E2F